VKLLADQGSGRERRDLDLMLPLSTREGVLAQQERD
jgi:hypothetical protein